MYVRGLKTGLIANLLLVLTGAMLLIDLVMIGSSRRAQLSERLATAQTLLGAAQVLGRVEGDPAPVQLVDLAREAEGGCLRYLDATGAIRASRGDRCRTEDPELRTASLQAFRSGHQSAVVTGGLAGLFRPEGDTLIVARPWFSGDRKIGVLTAELSLASLSRNLYDSQRIFLLYFLINLIVFVLLGFFRLYRTIVRPIDRLVTTAEEFRDDGEYVFPPAAREGEFNRLAGALNRMLTRINRDRTRVAQTVASLEEANRGLRRAQEEIIRAEKMASVGRLSAGIAHEIGNPIGIIIGYLDLLKQQGLSEDQRRDFLRRAEGEANRVNTIIRRLLDFARSAPEEPNLPIAVHTLLVEVRELFSVQPVMSGIELELDTGATEDRVVAAGDQLKQVFLNLLLNAADAINERPAGAEPGRIVIRTGNPERTLADGRRVLLIEVADNGPGFASEQLANVFDPFYTTKEPGKGTGLGLAICFSIA